jgi:hypothetical protein
VVLQGIDDNTWHGDRPAALACFGLHEPQLAVNALQTVSDVKPSRLEVDVFPREPEGLALAKSERQSHRVQSTQAIILSCSQQLLGLGRRKHPNIEAFDSG